MGDDKLKNEKKEQSLIEKWNEQMTLIEKKTGIHGIYVIILLVVSVLFVYLNIFDSLITNLVGTVYPAFWTMKSIESKGDDDKQWLTYWAVFASFTLVDMFSVFIVKFIPFYFLLKIIFLIWLFMPNSHGATIVYHLLVVRVFKSFENDIDIAADKVKEYTNELVLNSDNVDRFKQIKNTFTAMKSLKDKTDVLNQTMVIDKESINENNEHGDLNSTMIKPKNTCPFEQDKDKGSDKKKKPKIINIEDGKGKATYKKIKPKSERFETSDTAKSDSRKARKKPELTALKTETDNRDEEDEHMNVNKKSKTKPKK